LLPTDVPKQLLLEVKHRKKSALSTTEWKTIPWLETQKNLKDELLDILLDMPELLKDADRMALCTDKGDKNRLRQDAVAKCWIYDEQLRTWLAVVCPSSTGCAWECQQPNIGPISVEDIALAYALQTFWTACLLLYDTLRKASNPGVLLPEHTDPQIYVHNIVSTTPILLNPSSGMYGQHVMILPFALALQYAEATAKHREMVTKVMEGPQGELVKSLLLKVNFSSEEGDGR
jgi:hypothetical protein